MAGKKKRDVVRTGEAARMLGLTRPRLSVLCAQGRVVGAAKVGAHYAIPIPIRIDPPLDYGKRRQADRERLVTRAKASPDAKHVSGGAAARILGLSRARVSILLQEGRIVGAKKYGSGYLVPLPVRVDPPLETGFRKPGDEKRIATTVRKAGAKVGKGVVR